MYNSNEHNGTKTPKNDGVRIGTDTVCSFRASKTLRYHKNAEISSIDFDDNGEFCLSSADDESIQIYDINKGTHKSTVYSKKYGVALAKFTHSSGTSKGCIFASTKVDNTIRYVTFHDNSFVRYFKGHEKAVNSIEVSPLNDWFLSSSEDNTVKIWDIRSPNVQVRKVVMLLFFFFFLTLLVMINWSIY